VTADANAVLEIQDLVREARRKHGWRVFRPSQFVEAGLGDERSVVEALRLLTVRGYFTASLQVRCREGHTLWEGAPDDSSWESELDGYCARCNEHDDLDHCQLFLNFTVSEELPDDTPTKKG